MKKTTNVLPNDSSLVNAIKANDEKTLYAFTRFYSPRIYGLAKGFNLPEYECKEVVNEALYKIISKIDKFDITSNARFSTWIYRIAANTIKDKIKSKNRFKEIVASEEIIELGSAGDVHSITESHDGETPRDKIQILANDILAKALDKLPEQSRTVLLERAYEQPFKNIAALLSKKEGTVKVAHMRAIEKLKHIYIDIFNELDETETKNKLKKYLDIETSI